MSIQEQKTKIAFLVNEQAELETEIRILRNRVEREEEEEATDDDLGGAEVDRLFGLVSSSSRCSRRSQSFDNLTKMVKKELELSSSLDETLIQMHNNQNNP